ncbi:hypothetical protein GIB67_037491 [Kingdonia uniflora]|uniref:Uncharacterized protein n=1 Tax=Kingdonia uniflora TaxID=39325 RepID=A0A7J7KXG3_9MAGN|nr:hypothetical protein GIB67_037491 [Kingdonia uniflora]
MAMVPERSNPLHNFSMPHLKWGNQRLLRCMKVNPNEGITSSSRRSSSGMVGNNGCNGVDEIEAQVLLHLHKGANKKGFSGSEEKQPEKDDSEAAKTVVEKPWNLRTRRAACKSPDNKPSKSSKLSPPRKRIEKNHPVVVSPPKLVRLRGVGEKKERGKFSLSLPRDEIEEDYVGMFGVRPPRRPKKRVRIIQRQLDALLPGSCLYEVTADLYKIPNELES